MDFPLGTELPYARNGAVISDRDAWFQVKVSKPSPADLAGPPFSDSEEPSMGVGRLDDTECRLIRPSLDPSLVQSVSMVKAEPSVVSVLGDMVCCGYTGTEVEDISSDIDRSVFIALRFEELPLLLSDRGFPALDDGLYRQSAPQDRHRAHIGLALLHLTFAKKHPSQEALNLDCRGFAGGVLLEDEASKRWALKDSSM
jgi:hypothetical protein